MKRLFMNVISKEVMHVGEMEQIRAAEPVAWYLR
jgi:hypothetical protein